MGRDKKNKKQTKKQPKWLVMEIKGAGGRGAVTWLLITSCGWQCVHSDSHL